MKTITITFFIQALFLNSGFSQISVSGASAEALVNEVLSGQSITISNIEFFGSPNAIGYFNGNGMNIPFENGVLLTTGQINDVLGPNDSESTGVDNNYGSANPHLNALVGGAPCFNGANIEFDFVPSGDSLSIEYVFGSEEYPEYVGAQFTDIFGIFISGPGINGVQNIAVLPDGSPITINQINTGNTNSTPPVSASHPEYFVNNGIPLTEPYTVDSAYVEFDGLSVPLTASASLIPNETYHLEIAITDVGDGIFDSGVFLKAHSLTAGVANSNLSDAFSVSPNPATDFITVNYNRDAPGKVEIYDMIGNYIREFVLESQTKISLGNLPAGIYTLKFITTEGQCSKLISRI